MAERSGAATEVRRRCCCVVVAANADTSTVARGAYSVGCLDRNSGERCDIERMHVLEVQRGGVVQGGKCELELVESLRERERSKNGRR